jgi:hypothetical protein
MMNLSVPRNPPVCAACQQGKLKATPHPRVPKRTSSAFDLVHADLVPLDGISFCGMIHQPSTPYVKQQNGVVERRIQTLKDMERSMQSGAGVLDDPQFQAERH